MQQAPCFPRITALTLLLAGTMLAGTAHAAPVDTTQRPGPPSTEWNIETQNLSSPQQTPRWTKMGDQNKQHHPEQAPFMRGECMKHERPPMPPEHCSCMKSMPRPEAPLSPEAHKMLEDRISALHAKLGITQAQEPAWQKVEHAMRINEESMRAMIQEKRARKDELNAVESMEKAQNFAQEHADNLANVIAPFRDLYNAMTEEQRKNADAVFKEFRGMGGPHHHRPFHKAGKKHTGGHAKQEHKAPAVAGKNAPPANAPVPAPTPAPAMPESAPPAPAPAAQ